MEASSTLSAVYAHGHPFFMPEFAFPQIILGKRSSLTVVGYPGIDCCHIFAAHAKILDVTMQ
jgi:hypothetical protein